MSRNVLVGATELYLARIIEPRLIWVFIGSNVEARLERKSMVNRRPLVISWLKVMEYSGITGGNTCQFLTLARGLDFSAKALYIAKCVIGEWSRRIAVTIKGQVECHCHPSA
jgi:hypothetical protein